MKILLVDDHTLFRDGMKHLLQDLRDELELVESDSVQQALACLQGDTFDLILLDLQLSDTHGLDSLILVREQTEETPIIVLSAEQDHEIIHRSIEQGAMGFISKAATHEELLAAIQLILAGGVFLPREVTLARSSARVNGSGASHSSRAVLDSLSERQREVLRYLLQGKPNKTISTKLEISENTVKAHLSAIFRALGARNRTEAVYFAARAGVPMD